jgi:uncharacterized protein YkwD
MMRADGKHGRIRLNCVRRGFISLIRGKVWTRKHPAWHFICSISCMRFLFLLVLFFTALPCGFSRAGETPSAVLDEINFARTRPRQYAQILLAQQDFFRASGEMGALDEAVRFLQRTRPLPPLSYSNGLAMGAMSHVANQGGSGATGHYGADNSRPWDRMERYGRWSGCAGENIAYGYRDARRIVSALIVDAKVAGRGHRKNLFNADFRLAGVACGSHPRYGSMCVMDFAGGYGEGSPSVSRPRLVNAGWGTPMLRIAL